MTESEPVAVERGRHRVQVYWPDAAAGDRVEVHWRAPGSEWRLQHVFGEPGQGELDLGAGEISLRYTNPTIARHAVAGIRPIKPRTGPIEYERHTVQ